MLSIFPVAAFAAGGGTSPGGSDGCGLGWQVTDKKTWLGTTTRGTTNNFVPPSFGMTSGTIGCEQHPIAKNESEAAAFAYNNHDSLTAEMAAGQGEYVSGLAKSMGCDDAAVPAFSEMTQKNYKEIVGSDQKSGLDLYENVKSQVKKDGFLASHCRV
jgi:hypothetical protein